MGTAPFSRTDHHFPTPALIHLGSEVFRGEGKRCRNLPCV